MTAHRRRFLRAAGVSLALPWLDAFAPRARAAEAAPRRAWSASARRWGCIRPTSSPRRPGKDYALTPYLEVLKDSATTSRSSPAWRIRTSGPSHDSIYSFLTAAPHPERRAGFRNTISLDQFAAEHIGGADALPQPGAVGRGVRPLLDAQRRARCRRTVWPSSVFARLFLEGRPDEVAGPGPPAARRPEHPRHGRRPGEEDAAGLGAGDRDKLDEYFTSVRELEQRLAQGRGVVEEAQAEGGRQAAAGHHEPGRPHRQDPADVRPDPPGAADRFDPADHHAAGWARASCRRSRA